MINPIFCSKQRYCPFIFLGYLDEASFLVGTNVTLNQITPQLETDRPIKFTNHYIGAYYSVISYQVKYFALKLTFLTDTNRVNAQCWGFHNYANPQDESSIEYEGDGFLNQNLLCLQLSQYKTQNESIGLSNPMNIIAYTRTAATIEDQKFIRASLQTVSSQGYPLSLEVVFNKVPLTDFYLPQESTDVPTALDNDKHDILQLYLMLQRKNYYIPLKIFGEIDQFHARKSMINNYLNIVGIYRIWHFGFNPNDIIQSKMVITSNYQIILHAFIGNNDQKQLGQQKCVMSISRIRPKKLCISSHGKPGLSVINYGIIDLDSDQQDSIFDSIFCSIGYDNRGILGDYSVMKKTENSSFEVRKIEQHEREAYIKKHQLDRLMYRLVKLLKKKKAN